jgi:hypothetical protein
MRLFTANIIMMLTLGLSINANSQTNVSNIAYTNCANCWIPDSLGNHRAVVEVKDNASWVKAILPWRRRDFNPENKRIIIQDAQSNAIVTEYFIASVNRESGEIHFKPTTGKGKYYIYYLPYKNEGRSNYPKGVYLKPIENKLQDLPTNGEAVVLAFQSIDSLNSFFPMEVIATKKEIAYFIEKSTKATLNKGSNAFVAIPEQREYPIKMTKDLPMRWMNQDLTRLNGIALKGEWYAFQVGIYALQNIKSVQLQFSDLQSEKGQIIKASNISCINTHGISYDNKPIKKVVDVAANQVQALWCGVDVPTNATAGTYHGKLIVHSEGSTAIIIDFNLVVEDKQIANSGADQPWNQTRLKWLNSTLAQENEVIAPYTPLLVKQKEISLLGRKVILNEDGLPKQIQTFFSPEMTNYTTTPKNILLQPMQLLVNGDPIGKSKSTFAFTNQQKGNVQWTSSASSNNLKMQVTGSIEFDGFMMYSIKLTALENTDINDIQLRMPIHKQSAKYMMGLGQKGGLRPSNFDWKWDVTTKNQDGAWIGDVNAGMQFSLRDENYVRPLNTNFYLQKPLLLPRSWGNDNKGGIQITEKNDTVVINNYSGARILKKGDSLFYNFTLLITPFHTLNTNFQWDAKFFHSYQPIDTIKAISSASIVNIHHANKINPWINYPFIEHQKMKSYIDEAHQKGLKVKIYNTVRELSNHAYETFPLRSLGHEIYSPGKGGGYSWLQEHIGDDYIAAWFVPEIKDAAIVNSGMSRWHNYYIEGMNWLVKNVGIDGIYLDDVAFDRITMKRVKRVLTQQNHPGIIDLHSANQFNKNDGFNNSANLYMEHFPYINKLWFGEYFDYQKGSPDFYLTEVSGIPFGLMGEMLQDGGNPYRGMIYGMTNRMPWDDNADPRAIWKLWDEFGIKNSKMIGYWSENCPVKTNNDKVLATVYKKEQSVLISIASWAESASTINLMIDWKKLGLNPNKCSVYFPEVKNFQSVAKAIIENGIIKGIEIDKAKGCAIIIKEN